MKTKTNSDNATENLMSSGQLILCLAVNTLKTTNARASVYVYVVYLLITVET